MTTRQRRTTTPKQGERKQGMQKPGVRKQQAREMVLSIRGLRKRLGATELYDNLNLSAYEGEIIAIVGPNGSGKTSLFNIISGLITPDAGTVAVRCHKDMSYLFQNYRDTLFPWRTVAHNIGYPLEVRGIRQQRIECEVRALCKRRNIRVELNKYPYELSGGQQQITALLRSVITTPKLLLLDEPFSALDYENALAQRIALLRYHAQHNPTILVITHDIEEAVFLATRIMVLSRKPTKVAHVIANPLPYPRTMSTLRQAAFHRVAAKTLRAFQGAIQR